MTFVLRLRVFPEGSNSILDNMAQLEEQNKWDYPLGYDLGDLVKMPGVIPATLYAHTFDYNPVHGFIHRIVSVNLVHVRDMLNNSGFFYNFGHGPIGTVLNMLKENRV